MVAAFASWPAVFVSFLLAAILEVIALPDQVGFLRPEWLLLTLIYWLLRHPEKIGMSTSLLLGLVMDAISGTYLGIHMLSMSLSCYLVLTMHKRMVMFPVVQQSLVIFFIVGIQLMVVYLLTSALSIGDSGLDYLWQALSSALLWPFVLILTDRLVFALR
jgi:rod shape-determining protein MreD